MSSDLKVFWALMRRDLVMLRQRLVGSLLDTGSVAFTQTLLYGRFLPIMGMPTHWIAPVYMGATASFIFFMIFGYGLRNIFDIEYGRLIDFRLTLPITKRWLFAQQVAYYVTEALVITVPLLIVGIYFLRDHFSITPLSVAHFASFYLCGLTFICTFFLALSFRYNFHWFTTNMWPRRLSIIFNFSPFNFIWAHVLKIAPIGGYLMLANPLTYLVEGFRSTMLGGPEYIPWYTCFVMLLVFQVLAIWLFAHGVKKRLDPV